MWQALQGLPDELVVIAQYRVLDNRRSMREADFLVLIPDVGVGVLEVKGGRVSTRDGEWFSRDRRGYDHEIHNPILQASKAGYALRDFAWGQGMDWPSWSPVAVLPDTQLPGGFRPADSFRSQWIDARGMADLPALVSAAIYTDEAPDAARVDALVDLLEQRLPKPPSWQKARDTQAHADMLTRDQYTILRALRTNDRILVTGGPGTGKTWLALEHARQETLRGARVAVLCYNRGLALHMNRQATAWEEDQRPAFIGTLHQLALDWTGTEVPADADASFWDALPPLLETTTRAQADRFDLVVVDEAQDFAPDWWPGVRAILCDPDEGPMVVFGDEDQELYGRGALGVPAVGVSLTENVRNTVQIAAVLEDLSGEPQRCRGAQGPNPEFLRVRRGPGVGGCGSGGGRVVGRRAVPAGRCGSSDDAPAASGARAAVGRAGASPLRRVAGRLRRGGVLHSEGLQGPGTTRCGGGGQRFP